MCSIKQLIFFLLTPPPAIAIFSKLKKKKGKKADYLKWTDAYEVKTKQDSTHDSALYFFSSTISCSGLSQLGSVTLGLIPWVCSHFIKQWTLQPQSQQEVCHWLQLRTGSSSIIRNLELNKAARKGTGGKWGGVSSECCGAQLCLLPRLLGTSPHKISFSITNKSAKVWPPWVGNWGLNALNMGCSLIWEAGKGFQT